MGKGSMTSYRTGSYTKLIVRWLGQEAYQAGFTMWDSPVNYSTV